MNTKNLKNLIFDTSRVYLIFLFCVGLTHAQRVDVVDHLGNKAQTGTVVTESTTGPTSPKQGDIWIDTSKTPNTTNIWDGTDWTEVKPSYQSVLQDSDGNTKIQLEETTDDDTIRFDTGGEERMVIKDEGNVGIGTTSPITQSGGIHVNHSSVEGTPSAVGDEVGVFQRNAISAQSVAVGLVGGTASTSSLYFGDKDDIDIGKIVYNNSDNSMRFHANASERMRIDSSGRVGIGSSNPSALLEVATPSSGSAAVFNLLDNTADGFVVKQGSNEYISVDTTNAAEVITLGNTTTIADVIIPVGNVGIGTSSPYAPLSIGSVTGDTYAVFDNGAKARLTFNGDASAAKIFATTTGFANYEDLEFRADNYLFKTDNTTERMRIDSYGRVNIGGYTNSQGYELEVVNDTDANTLLLHREEVSVGVVSTLGFQGTQANDQSARFAEISSEFGVDWGGDLVFSTKPPNGTPNNTVSERMRIDSSGNVGIGTTIPSAPLDVDGSGTGIDLANFGGSTQTNYSKVNFNTDTLSSQAYIIAYGSGNAENKNVAIKNTNSDGDVFFTAGNAERLRINSSGNVGIGTSSPTNKTHIYNTANIGGIYAENTNASFTESGLFVNNTSSTGGNLLKLRSLGSDKVVVLGTGNVGIGTSSPSTALDVAGIVTADQLIVNGEGEMAGMLTFTNSDSDKRGITGTMAENDYWFVGGAGTGRDYGYLEISTGDNGNNSAAEPIYVRQYGPSSPLIGTSVRTATLLDNSGNTHFPGNITNGFSDERLKTKTGNINNALEKVQSLSGFYYVENELAKQHGYSTESQQVGLSAQEVQAVLPEAVSLAPFDRIADEVTNDPVSKSGEDYLTVDYSRLVPLLIESIKELKTEVEDLKTQLENN